MVQTERNARYTAADIFLSLRPIYHFKLCIRL